MSRIKVKRFKGVYFRTSTKRTHRGKPDKCYDISFKDSNGRLIWEKAGWSSEGYTAQLASQVRGERIRTLRHGRELPVKKGDRTLQKIWDKEYKVEKSSKKSYKDDVVKARRLISYFQKTRLRDLNAGFIDRYIQWRKLSKISNARINRELALLKHFFTIMVHDRKTEVNPVKQIKMLPEPKYPARILTKDEKDRLFKVLPNFLKPIVLMALKTGMRLMLSSTTSPTNKGSSLHMC